ncbi:glutamine synthetase family protein [Geomicrobium sp. JCM 19055]|nr:glutamine synthetase [Geomicrobium sp. JCM 19055]GAJ98358.1 glutamine synthetase family protein [Geomicrobium sp. JCM 19055]
MMTKAGVPIESSKGEAHIGQHEINLKYGDALTSADRHILLKHGMKEMAIQQDYALTFMAKPHHDWTGSSGHIHLSLTDESGNTNYFYDEHETNGMSETMQHFF